MKFYINKNYLNLVIFIIGIISYLYLYTCLINKNYTIIFLYYLLLIVLYFFINKHAYILCFIGLLIYYITAQNIIEGASFNSNASLDNVRGDVSSMMDEKKQLKPKESRNNCEKAVTSNVANSNSADSSQYSNGSLKQLAAEMLNATRPAVTELGATGSLQPYKIR